MTYRPRIVDARLVSALRSAGGVVIDGPRGCGKTRTAAEHAQSSVSFDRDPNARLLAKTAPDALLDGPTPRLLDEWQLAPEIWGSVRGAIDDRGQPGQFILTGSAVPVDDGLRHTGAARFIRITMRPCTLAELGISSGAVSLAALLERDASQPTSAPDTELSIPDLFAHLTVGGFPGVQGTAADTLDVHREYLASVAHADIPRLLGRAPRPARLAAVIRALARHTGGPLIATSIAADVVTPGRPIDPETIALYLDTLARVHVIEPLPSWGTHLRSRARQRSVPVVHFTDPALAAAAIGATPQALLKDLRLAGLLFESLVIRDLRVYADAARGTVEQYRDNTGLEVDAIVTLPDGRWGAFEIKLGTFAIDDAAATLRRFADKIDTRLLGTPSVLGVIVGNGGAYRRADGITVIPIGALGP
jgi:uncharacterized protein